jgi:hypothetical protein
MDKLMSAAEWLMSPEGKLIRENSLDTGEFAQAYAAYVAVKFADWASENYRRYFTKPNNVEWYHNMTEVIYTSQELFEEFKLKSN